jgi:protein-L-isoaspartate(D-aspartate) O-methyltransferase
MPSEALREQMVSQQVRPWDVLDAHVLETLRRLPRERFVPALYRDAAFADAEIPLGHGEHMLAPKIVGRILQALDLGPRDAVLEVGTGSGYLTAAMALQCARVRSIDRHEDFIAAARPRITALGLGAVELAVGDAFVPADLGSGSWDVVVLTGSLPVYDPRFEQRLAVGGRLFVTVGSAPVMQACLVRRVSATEWVRSDLFETVIAPLVGAPQPPQFRF